MKIKAISLTANRKTNQDSLLIEKATFCGADDLNLEINSNDIHFFAIADGAGGAAMGEQCSKIAVETLSEFIGNELSIDSDPTEIESLIIKAFEKAQTCVMNKLFNEDMVGGTTLSLLVILGENRYLAFNVGDSPIYLIRNQEFTPLSKPHTLAQYKKDNGFPEEEIEPKDYHCLMQSLGTFGYTQINIAEGTYLPEDKFIVMSDGLEQLGNDMEKIILSETFDKDVLNHLYDNVSAILIMI